MSSTRTLWEWVGKQEPDDGGWAAVSIHDMPGVCRKLEAAWRLRYDSDTWRLDKRVVRDAVFEIYRPTLPDGRAQTYKVSKHLTWDQSNRIQTPVLRINRISTTMLQRAFRVDPTDATVRPRVYQHSDAHPESPNVSPILFSQFQYSVSA